MSEFSQSYHVASDRQEDAVELLQRAGLGGWVFPPSNGWISFLPDPDEFGTPAPALITANAGTLLYYLNAEDHGWTFTIWQGPEVACAYGCSWEDGLEIQDSALDLNLVGQIVSVNALEPHTAKLTIERLLRPESREHLLAYAVHTEGRNPGHGFAEAIGLEHFPWLSTDYVKRDGGHVFGVETLRVG